MKIVEQTPTKLVIRQSFWRMQSILLITLSIITFVSTLFFTFLLVLAIIKSTVNWLFVQSIGGILLCLLYLIFSDESVTCTLDKSLDRMSLKRQKILKTRVIERPIEAISGVQLDELTDSDSDTIYRVSLVFASGRCIPLNSSYSGGLKDKLKIAEDIAIFLNVFNYGVEGAPIPGSITHWKEVIRLNPNDADAYRNLGMALYRENNKRYKKEVLASLKHSSKLLKAQGDDEEARRCLQLYWTIYWNCFTLTSLKKS